MSLRAMTAVWDRAPVAGSELLLMLALADAANDDLECWPGIRHLARKVRVSERHVSRLLENLERQGLIQRILHGGRGQYEGWESNRYRLLLEMENGETAPIPPGTRGSSAAATPSGCASPKSSDGTPIIASIGVSATPSHHTPIPPSGGVAVMSSPDVQITPSPDTQVRTSPDAQTTPSPDTQVRTSPDLHVTPSPDVQVRTSPDTQVTQNHQGEPSGEAEKSARASARVEGRARVRADATPLPNRDRPALSGREAREAIIQAYWAGIDGFGTPPAYLQRDAAELVGMGATVDEVRQLAAEKQAGRIEQYELRWLVEDFGRWKGEQRRKAKERAEIEAMKVVVERERAWTRELLGRKA